MIDRYLKMTGVQPTNPPNMRSLRKFEAGNIIEWIVRFVLQRAGIVRDFQEEVWVEYDGLLKVKGKMDFIAGGILDPEKAKSDVSALGLPESIERTSLYIVEKLTEIYGTEALKLICLEIKSCSSFVMDRMEVTNAPIKKHTFQCFHYIKGLDMDEGHLAYICKDDMRMAEFPIFNPGPTQTAYIADLQQITHYLTNRIMPSPERAVIWSQETGKFSKNLDIEYSPYLTMVYGYDQPRNYSDRVSPIVARWNRVVKRYADGNKITEDNKKVKDEIIASGYNFDEVVHYFSPVQEEV
jgi:hypothetical protein